MIEHFDCITFASEISNLKSANSYMILDMLYRRLYLSFIGYTCSLIVVDIICNRDVLGLVCLAGLAAELCILDCISFVLANTKFQYHIT